MLNIQDPKEARKIIRRSVIAKIPMKKGDRITLEKIKFARPGTGISPNDFFHINGHRLTKDVDAEDILQWEMLET